MEKASKTAPTEPRDSTAWPEVGSGQLDEGDVSLIRSMLARTPTERLRTLQGIVDGVTALRDGRIERQ
ncbi:MAG: hypothetical protein V3T72_10870 [Thermoanaerobaculia bacterium]